MLSLSRNKFSVLILVILLSVPSIWPLLIPGFFTTDDGNWMVIRFSAFYQALSDGQFPVRWLTRLNQSYGYPVANFLYPGFMYLAVPLKLAGLSFVGSVKAVMALSMVMSGLFSYLWLRAKFSALPSGIGALLYVYFPYHVYDLYARGSVGELLALALVPFVLWQIDRKSFVLSAVGIFFLILSHNSLAFMFLPVISVYALLKNDFRKMHLWYLSVIVLGVALAAFFWLPALADLSYTVFSETQVSDWSSYFADISLVGFSLPIIFITSLFIAARKGNLVTKDKVTVFFLVLGLLALFLSTRLSSVVWEVLPASIFQFPFRFLSVVILSGAFLGAYCIENIKNQKAKITVALLLLTLLYPSLIRIFSVEVYPVNDDVLATNEDTTTVKNEYMPIWVKEVPTTRPDAFLYVGEDQAPLVMRPTSMMDFEIETDQREVISLNHLYFPGWEVSVNGQAKEIDYRKDGLISFDIDPGVSKISIVFRETGMRLFADTVSVLSFLLLFILAYFFRKKAYAKDTKIF